MIADGGSVVGASIHFYRILRVWAAAVLFLLSRWYTPYSASSPSWMPSLLARDASARWHPSTAIRRLVPQADAYLEIAGR